MYICAERIMNDKSLGKHQYRYSFGADFDNLDGIICIDTENINNSFVEKKSKSLVNKHAAFRLIVTLFIKIKDTGEVPAFYEYMNC